MDSRVNVGTWLRLSLDFRSASKIWLRFHLDFRDQVIFMIPWSFFDIRAAVSFLSFNQMDFEVTFLLKAKVEFSTILETESNKIVEKLKMKILQVFYFSLWPVDVKAFISTYCIPVMKIENKDLTISKKSDSNLKITWSKLIRDSGFNIDCRVSLKILIEDSALTLDSKSECQLFGVILTSTPEFTLGLSKLAICGISNQILI